MSFFAIRGSFLFLRQPAPGREISCQRGMGCFWHALARGGFVPPGTTYFCRQAKVGKNWLRGFTPKDPVFLKQGRGGVYIKNDVGRRITYEPRHSPAVRLPACETVTH